MPSGVTCAAIGPRQLRGGAIHFRKRLPLTGGVLVVAWLLVLFSKTSRVALRSAPTPPRGAASAGSESTPTEPAFRSYDQAIDFVRSHYQGESINTGRSSWITSAEYFPADGRGYLILGMQGRPYIFASVPEEVWQEFKDAPSLGRYYNQSIRGRYRLNLR